MIYRAYFLQVVSLACIESFIRIFSRMVFFTILEVRSDDRRRYYLSLRIFTSLLAHAFSTVVRLHNTRLRIVGDIPLGNYDKS